MLPAGWEPYNLHAGLEHASWVGSVLCRTCATSHHVTRESLAIMISPGCGTFALRMYVGPGSLESLHDTLVYQVYLVEVDEQERTRSSTSQGSGCYQ